MEMTLAEVKNRLHNSPFRINSESRGGNGNCTVLKLSNGSIVNCWDTGKVSFQGKKSDELVKLLQTGNCTSFANNKVFVVYGHDQDAKTQLEAMLRRWDLEPLILDQLPSNGATIIEKLESYTSQADFGIVLATPDDIGYAKDSEDKKRYRVRQNVVLELGMLLSSKGRSKVAILLSQKEKDMEPPSDIGGLIYIPFKDNVEETKLSLAKEMKKHGYLIDIEKL